MCGTEFYHNLHHHPWLANTFRFSENGSSKLLSDVCNNLWAFLLPVSMTTPWHAWRLRKRGGRQTLSFHCAKMPSLPSTAILSQANTTQASHGAATTKHSYFHRYKIPPKLSFISKNDYTLHLQKLLAEQLSKICPLWRRWENILMHLKYMPEKEVILLCAWFEKCPWD